MFAQAIGAKSLIFRRFYAHPKSDGGDMILKHARQVRVASTNGRRKRACLDPGQPRRRFFGKEQYFFASASGSIYSRLDGT
ncbi:hypothetical protein AUR61_013570 [Stutzerimonas balearica]|nr:hypothetical protein AUR61_013570 [Stutzerimonas balearica]